MNQSKLSDLNHLQIDLSQQQDPDEDDYEENNDEDAEQEDLK